MLCYAILYCTILLVHHTVHVHVLLCSVLYCTVLLCTVMDYTALHCTALRCPEWQGGLVLPMHFGIDREPLDSPPSLRLGNSCGEALCSLPGLRERCSTESLISIALYIHISIHISIHIRPSMLHGISTMLHGISISLSYIHVELPSHLKER